MCDCKVGFGTVTFWYAEIHRPSHFSACSALRAEALARIMAWKVVTSGFEPAFFRSSMHFTAVPQWLPGCRRCLRDAAGSYEQGNVVGHDELRANRCLCSKHIAMPPVYPFRTYALNGAPSASAFEETR